MSDTTTLLAARPSSRSSLERRVLIPGRTWGLIIAVALLIAICSYHSKTFLQFNTLFVQSRLVSQYVLVALAQAVCLVVGGMNLSVGAISSLSTVALGVCLTQWAPPDVVGEGNAIALAVGFALAVGLACGLINGLLVVLIKINPFIVTLSTMFVFQGLRSGISGGKPYVYEAPAFGVVGQGSIFGVPYFFLIMLAVLVVVAYMYRNTVFGRRMLATGGNEDAARLSGIRTGRMVIGANVLSGFIAALVAILYASENGSAAPETGDGWLIVSFAVAIIGGTGLNGGIISALGILMGGIIYTLIRYELYALKANTYYMNVYFGLLILLAIVIDRGREIYGQRKRQTPETAAEPPEPHSD